MRSWSYRIEFLDGTSDFTLAGINGESVSDGVLELVRTGVDEQDKAWSFPLTNVRQWYKREEPDGT